MLLPKGKRGCVPKAGGNWQGWCFAPLQVPLAAWQAADPPERLAVGRDLLHPSRVSLCCVSM